MPTDLDVFDSAGNLHVPGDIILDGYGAVNLTKLLSQLIDFVGWQSGGRLDLNIKNFAPIPVEIAAAGSTQGTATTAVGPICRVTNASGSNGLILAMSAGDRLQIINPHATNAVNVYPPCGGQNNSLGTNAAFVLNAGTTVGVICVNSTTFTTATAAYP